MNASTSDCHLWGFVNMLVIFAAGCEYIGSAAPMWINFDTRSQCIGSAVRMLFYFAAHCQYIERALRISQPTANILGGRSQYQFSFAAHFEYIGRALPISVQFRNGLPIYSEGAPNISLRAAKVLQHLASHTGYINDACGL
jgi:hypothetical protein